MNALNKKTYDINKGEELHIYLDEDESIKIKVNLFLIFYLVRKRRSRNRWKRSSSKYGIRI